MKIKYILLSVLLWAFPLFAHFTNKLDSYSDFERYSLQLDGTRTTKCVIDLETKTIYYFDVGRYELHTYFCFQELLKTTITDFRLREFNKNYSEAEKPKFILCYLNHHLQQNLWTFALWEGDKASKETIEYAKQFLDKSFFLSHELYFQPNSTFQEKVASTLSAIPVITNDELYHLCDYKPMNVGSTVGRLRLVDEGDTGPFAIDEIVVLEAMLPDITPVAGIITEQFATPLSHLSLRARAWGIPNVGLKGAIKKLQTYDGIYVSFSACREDFTIRPATEEEIEAARKARDKKPPLKIPAVDLLQKALKPLTSLSNADIAAFGAKAANLGSITSYSQVPAGFAIPMHYYAEHIKKCRIGPKMPIEEVQKEIFKVSLDTEFLNTAWQTAQQLGNVSLFVRSSTNAEDLEGFNGAGLYDTVANVKDKEGLEEAIKQVWASIYNPRAILERNFFGIDHMSVYSACIVQIGVNAQKAGVLITKDIFEPKETMEVYTINAKWGLGEGVVSGTTTPEQILYNFDNKGIKVLSRASDEYITVFDEQGGLKKIPNPKCGMPVLSDDQATELANAAYQIKRRFGAKHDLDIEWLFDNEKLYIVQVRPYVEK